LNIRPGLTYVDATVGAGGHLAAIRERMGSGGKLVGIDKDKTSLDKAAARLPAAALYVHGDYSDIGEHLHSLGISTVDGGILADLGVSSMQLDNPGRGFSFLKDGPLDMRMDNTQKLSAATIVNEYQEREIADIIFKYGEERLSRQIARRIVSRRPILTTAELSEIVAGCIYTARGTRGHNKNRSKSRSDRLDDSHPATRTFQALRIAVNSELASLEKFLHESVKILAPGARLVVISFHSLEDRIVKQILRLYAKGCVCPPRHPVCTCGKHPELLIMTSKPVTATDAEVLANIRSRSAKLRVGEKI
jgi:16S rRNA (cytosine1402-N4)-methyltransferase